MKTTIILSEKIKYKDIIDLNNLKKGLERTKNNVSPGFNGEVIAHFNEKKLITLNRELKSQKFKPSLVKRVNIIPKSNGKTRLLGVASQKDKVVQAAILSQLEPVLENIFLDCSYGGRPNKNCHHALKNIKTKWQNITWIISIDIQKYFNIINYELLLIKLEEYCDQSTIELIRKFLKCGYIDIYNHSNTLEKSKIGKHQSSLISPILSNLYLHSFDCFMLMYELFPDWNRGDKRKYISGYQTRNYKSVEKIKSSKSLNIEEVKQTVGELKHNQWIKAKLSFRDSKDDGFRRLRYVRYFDDFIIGFTGTKVKAKEIKSIIELYLNEELLLKTKSCIKHFSEKGILYLGYYIRCLAKNKIVKDSKFSQKQVSGIGYQLKAMLFNQVQLRIPVELIFRCAVDRGYAKIRKDGKSIRATSCRKLSSLEDKLIVQRFSSIIKGLTVYYSPANKLSDLWQVVALYRKSCALTLANKHKLKTAAKTFKRYGSNLKISNPIKHKETVLFYPTRLTPIINFKMSKTSICLSNSKIEPIQRSYKSLNKTSNKCQFPGCESSTNFKEH
jgi:RNA-directed DNA polymerase